MKDHPLFFYSPSARKTSSKELWETRNWFTIANYVQEKEDLVRIYWMHISYAYLINFDLPSAALSEYRVVKISWMLTSLGKLMWTVFACFVTILASLWIFVWTNCKRESTVSSLSWAKLSYVCRVHSITIVWIRKNDSDMVKISARRTERFAPLPVKDIPIHSYPWDVAACLQLWGCPLPQLQSLNITHLLQSSYESWW